MYSRKIKVSKKKTKSGGNEGSNWGPRVALTILERERIQQQTIIQKIQQQHNHNHHHHNNNSSSNPAGSSGASSTGGVSNSVTYSHHYSHSQQAPSVSSKQSHSTKSKDKDHHHNTGNGNGNRPLVKPLSVIIPPQDRYNLSPDSFGPDHDSLPSTQTWRSSSDPDLTLDHQQDQHDDDENDEHDEHDGLESHENDHISHRNGNNNSNIKKHHHNTRYQQHQSHSHNEDNKIPPPPEFSMNSSQKQQPQQEEQVKPFVKLRAKLKPESSSSSTTAITTTTSSSAQNGKSNPVSSVTTTGHDLSSSTSSSSSQMTKSKVNGSHITALAQGFGKVYVPMERKIDDISNSTSASTSVTFKSKSTEEKAVQNLNAIMNEKKGKQTSCSSSSSSSGGSSNNNNNNNNNIIHNSKSIKPVSNGKTATNSERENTRHPVNGECQAYDEDENDGTKDGDADSLLESFDSIIFKPKSAIKSNSSSTQHKNGSSSSTAKNVISSSTTITTGNKLTAPEKPFARIGSLSGPARIKQQISESPPPLPPPNSKKPDKKNIRFSEQLENFQNSTEKKVKAPAPAIPTAGGAKQMLGKKVSIPSAPETAQKQPEKNPDPKKSSSSSSTNNSNNQHHHHNSNGNDHADNNKSSEHSFPSSILSCGHLKTSSNYSTLSSIISTLTEESDNENEGERDPRSALQQLRDLSLLISSKSNFHSPAASAHPNTSSTNPHHQTSSSHPTKLKGGECSKIRRDSDSSGSSGTDSGKGSGSGQSPKSTDTSPKGKNSSASYPSSCAFSSSGGCEDCVVFKNPLAADSNHHNHHHGHSHHQHSSSSGCQSSSSSSASPNDPNDPTSTTTIKTTGPRSDSHYRPHHLIIQDQNRKSSSTNSSMNESQSKKLKKSKKSKKSHDLILEYCDCSQCDCEATRRGGGRDHNHNHTHGSHRNPSKYQNPMIDSDAICNCNSSCAPIQIPNNPHNNNSSNNNNNNNNMINHNNHVNRNGGSKKSSTSSSSDSLVHHTTNTTTTNSNSSHNHINNNNNNPTNLFTIDEEEAGDLLDPTNPISNFMNVKIKDFKHEEGKEHWHPNCWLQTDATMGWSDLESLYSQNMKLDKPANINDECWTCWAELAQNRKNGFKNTTIDRTKRMFIWLNRRQEEFNLPWWEAKKQASIRWLITKSFSHVPKEALGDLLDPFKESKKGKPKYRLKDEVIKGLVNGKLYCLALDNLYQNDHRIGRGLSHWDIIKILSRRGVYVAQPSDMKLTEGTLRQKKPLRIAAHIALVEAIMSLYTKEMLVRERIIATLHSFGQIIEPESVTAEELLISWINACMMTLKSYVLTNKSQNNNPSNQNMESEEMKRYTYWRTLDATPYFEIRDLCDGIGICSLFALYCSNDLQVNEIAVPEPDELLNIYDTIANHSIIERLCHDLFPESIYHLCITDFLYIHGYMKQNILCFLVDLFNYLEMNPIIRVKRLISVPIRIEL